jgi:hypothetical protein
MGEHVGRSLLELLERGRAIGLRRGFSGNDEQQGHHARHDAAL